MRFRAPWPAAAHAWYVRSVAGGSWHVPLPFQVPKDAGASRPSRMSSATSSPMQVTTCHQQGSSYYGLATALHLPYGHAAPYDEPELAAHMVSLAHVAPGVTATMYERASTPASG